MTFPIPGTIPSAHPPELTFQREKNKGKNICQMWRIKLSFQLQYGRVILNVCSSYAFEPLFLNESFGSWNLIH